MQDDSDVGQVANLPSAFSLLRLCGFIVATVFFAGLVIGCLPPPKSVYVIELEQQVGQLTYENEEMGRRIAERDGKIEALRMRLAEVQDLPTDLLSKLFTTRRLTIGKLTGGADYDDRPGDDGITVYLAPLDRDGDPVKAAGEIEVFLYDLTVPGQPRELGHYVINEPARLREAWYSGWMTNHYTIKCEWPPGVEPPASREVQVRATFLDWLTGEKFVATKLVKVAWVDRQ
ncbi:MAG: hypothetical protein KAV82_07920 [Phycisphaerae bacterium]|nr:hypothetical protein [Phycisphaerae bacterium]